MNRITSSRTLRAILVLSRSTDAETRCFASEPHARARKYLDAWVGSSPSHSQVKPSKKVASNSNSKMAPLLVSGSSYLIPTLRIERSDTPENISTRIAAALDDSQHSRSNNTGIVKSMLRGKLTKSERGTRWQVPIILDFAALIPDGSPHYSPPPRGLLTGLVKALADYDIRVVGVTNTPSALEEDAVEILGLPAFMSKGRVLDRMSSKVSLESVVERLLVKSQQDYDEDAKMLKDDSSTRIQGEAWNERGIEESKDDVPMESATDDFEAAAAMDSTNDDDDGDSSNDAPITINQDPAEPSIPATPIEGESFLYHGSVRSGQQVAAPQNQSLIVIGSVNSGGEVMSDRDIFVFGKLRGRALAGLNSTGTARKEVEEEAGSSRIFATSFDAELICIGDTFTTVDSVTELGLKHPGDGAMVTLNSNRELIFQRIPL